ncbi:MAG TPA: hypothetical protein VHT52_11965 [Stellaceae bacterium]|nr:hypothetical protein [Stellaceae bacterium]
MTRNLIELAANGVGLLSATRFEIFICPACPNAHIVLFDSDDMPFAQMTVGPAQFDVIEGGCLDVFEEVRKRGGR